MIGQARHRSSLARPRARVDHVRGLALLLASAVAHALPVGLAVLTRAAPASAHAVEPPVLAPPGQPLSGGNLGPSLSLVSGLCVPPEGGRLGLPIAGDVRYGIAVGPLIVAPGGRIASFFVPGAVGLAGLAALRITLPLTQLAPYLAVGLGPGYRSAPAQLALAYQASGGLIVSLSERLSVGLEASYFQLVGSHFRRLSLGPSFSLGF